MRQIGKSIMDMPKSVEDLRLMGKEYMKNLGATEDLQDEQVYLQYIEEHLNAQAREAQAAESRSQQRPAATLSPIRNLADYYQRKLNKIQGHNESALNVTQSRSPKRASRVPTSNQTLVDIDQMTVVDLEKLEKSPPRINPRRKHMKMVNNKAMTQFGPEAFNLNLGEAEAAEPMARLSHQK